MQSRFLETKKLPKIGLLVHAYSLVDLLPSM